jgi:hypothetical protein
MACNNGRFLWDMNGIVWDRYTNGVPRQDDRLWSWILKMVMIFNGIYPLVNIQNYWTSPLLIRQSTITGPFSTGMLNYQRVYIYNIHNYNIYIYICMYGMQATKMGMWWESMWYANSVIFLCKFGHSFHVLIQFWIIHNEMDNHDSRFESWCCDKPVVFISC